MSKEELLKYLIAEIDLIMHDKDYRFENEDGTWYSRESCRNLTNEEMFEELRTELRQLSDLEAKLADLQAEQIKEMQEHQVAMLVADKKIKELEDYYTGYTEALVTEIQELKEQPAEKQKGKIEYTDTINFVETSEPDIVANELDRLNQKLAEKDKEIESLTTDLQEALTLIKEGRELVGLNNKVLEQPHQDKISFCIKQLEKVKETTECVLDNALKNSSLNQSYYDRLLDEIDNQIKQLKEGK